MTFDDLRELAGRNGPVVVEAEDLKALLRRVEMLEAGRIAESAGRRQAEDVVQTLRNGAPLSTPTGHPGDFPPFAVG